VDALSLRNIPIPIVTGAGTGTYKQHADSGVFNEVQPGKYPTLVPQTHSFSVPLF
jgi:D-serine deaminase-like pyridoxal phosphate-dependent protein